MRVLVLGAGGFLGRQVVAEFIRREHHVVAVVRGGRGLNEASPSLEVVSLDIALAVDRADWAPFIGGVDCIVNCAGILHGKDMDAVHVTAPKALYAAAASAGIQQAVLVSAISARADVATDYSQSKLEGERTLMASGLSWTILRPSLIYGDGSYGGTSLLRGLAGMPLLTPLPSDGQSLFSPIHVRDVARTIGIVCGNPQFFNRSIDPAGPDQLSLRTLLRSYRRWLGFGDARFISIPMLVLRTLAKAGDLVGNGPVSSNSLKQMIAGNAGDGEAFAETIGFRPRALESALRDKPAQVQDRWHARLYFLPPAVKLVMVLLWLVSAWLGMVHGDAMARETVRGLGLDLGWALSLKIAGSGIDLAIAAYVLLERRAWRSAVAQALVIASYTAILSWAVPELWLDPLGPLLKNLPILALLAVYAAIGEKR